MAEQDISIHDLPNGVLTEDSLFAMAYPISGGYASGKIAASALGKGLGEDVEFASLQTGNKTMFGAINELSTASYGKVLTATMTAGQTTVTFTDSDIKADSLIDVYSDPVLNIVGEQSSAGSYAVTFEAQSSDVAVAIVIKGYGSGGGINKLSVSEDITGINTVPHSLWSWNNTSQSAVEIQFFGICKTDTSGNQGLLSYGVDGVISDDINLSSDYAENKVISSVVSVPAGSVFDIYANWTGSHSNCEFILDITVIIS